MADDGSLDVTDFEFRPLQRSRIAEGPYQPSIERGALAVSSKYQVGVACYSQNTFTCFNTYDVHRLSMQKDNPAKEFTELPRKTVVLDSSDKIVSLAVNSDESLLGVLVTKSAGAFVYIYDIQALSLAYKSDVYHLNLVRIGQNESSKGLALEWNPAVADTFAASATDNTVIVAKIDIKNPSNVTIVADKRLGAAAVCISWSPKGKQLVVGDTLGKISQLKPELDVVRSTMPPNLQLASPSNAVSVCGLCWLATTEWFIAYSVPAQSDVFAFVLTLKKDQPPSWKGLDDVSYVNPASPLSAVFTSSASLLLQWNLIVTCFAKSSEVTVLGKRDDSWKIWSPEEEFRADLPTDSTHKDTFPLGMAIDMSSSTNVSISHDGSKQHRPSPILFVLTTDGILLAFNIVSHVASHADCQIKPQPVNIATARIGKRPEGQAAPPPAAASSTNPGSLFGSAKPLGGGLFGSPVPAGASASSLFGGAGKQGLFGTDKVPTTGATVPAPVSNATPVTTSSKSAAVFGGISTTLPPSNPLPTSSTSLPRDGLVPIVATTTTSLKRTETSSSSPAKPVVSVPATVVAATVESTEDRENARRKALQGTMKVLSEQWTGLTKDLRALQIGIQNAGVAIKNTEDDLHNEDPDVMNEMLRLKLNLENTYGKLEKGLKEGLVRVAEKHEIADQYESDKARVKLMKDSDDFDRDERMRRVVLGMDCIKEKYADTKKGLEDAKKINTKQSVGLLVSSAADHKFTQKQSKAVQKATQRLRWKVETLEDEMLQLNLKCKHVSSVEKNKALKNVVPAAPTMNVLKVQPIPNPSGDIDAMRQKMRELMILKAKEPCKLRVLAALPFAEQEKEMTKKNVPGMSISQLKQHVVQMASPRSSAAAARGAMSDAATQADTPAPAVVKAVPVLSFSPAKTASQPPKNIALQGAGTTAMSATPVSKAFARLPTGDGTPQSFSTSTTSAQSRTSTPALDSSPFTGKSFFGAIDGQPTSAVFSPIAKSTTVVPSPLAAPPKEPTQVAEQKVDQAAPPATVATEVEAAQYVQPIESPEPLRELPQISENDNANKAPTSENVTTVTESQPAVTASSTTETTPATTISPIATVTEKTTATTTTSSSIFGGSPAATSTMFGGIPAATKTPGSLFGGTVATSPSQTSVFGGAVKTEATPSSTAGSIFGGGPSAPMAAAGGGAFGSFGQAAPSTVPAAPASVSAFSFKPKDPVATATNASSFSFAPKAASSSNTGFLAAAAKAVAEEGMMEDDMGGAENQAGKTAGGFGSGFMSGLSLGGGGSSSSAATAPRNVFGSATSNTGGATSQKSWFGASQLQTPQPAQPAAGGSVFGSFGAAAAATPKQSVFGGGVGASPAASGTSVFGGAPRFGGAPAFGSKPAFGGGSPFGTPAAQPAQQGSIFGGGAAAAPAGGGGFASFAGAKTFGSTAGSTGGSSIFGGSAAAPAQTNKPSIFGGSQEPKTSFNTWR